MAVLLSLLAAGVLLGQDDNPKPITGQCHCGQIRYEAQGPAIESNYCDCRGCQRATGTLKSPVLVVRRAGFRIVAGEPASYRAASGVKCDAHGTWHFCPKCGTQIYWKPDRGNNVDLFAGTLDDLAVFQPKK